MAQEQTNSPAPPAESAEAVEHLSPTALVAYGQELGLTLDPASPPEELRQAIRNRRDLLAGMDREAMLDIVVWARRPVRVDSSKEELAREISQIAKTSFSRLSHRGMVALVRLRGLEAPPEATDRDLILLLSRNEGLLKRLERGKRKLVAGLLSSIFEAEEAEQAPYEFLPPEAERSAPASLKRRIEDQGIVGGIKATLRGAADSYVAEKLDEIERRIDAKLDQIDRRLAEWRDREIAHRLRIIKITIVATIIVAGLSLVYEIVKRAMQ